MNFHIRVLCVGLLCALIIGCASAKLDLELAIYKEDPFADELLVAADLDEILADLDGLDNEVERVATARISLAEGLFSAYGQYRWLVARERKGEKYTKKDLESDLSILKQYLGEFEDHVNETRQQVLQLKETAVRWLNRYKELLPRTEEESKAPAQTPEAQNRRARVRNSAQLSLKGLRSSLNRLAGPSGTKFERTLQDGWKDVEVRMQSKQIQKWVATKEDGKKELSALKDRVEELSSRIKTIQEQGQKVSRDLVRGLDSIKREEGAVPVAYVLAGQEGISVGYSDQFFRQQAKAFELLSTQIERLQDPADPVWKIVTDPANANKWNVEFSRTYFRAEGDSSVVVVRDSPIDFRVQQGNNNPTALVQAQLQVSRAIADAAITVAGATTGVNLTTLPRASERTGHTDGKLVMESEKMARLQAKIRREAELRAIAVNKLAGNLRSLRGQLETLDPDDEKEATLIEKLLDVLVSTLKADALFFEGQSIDR